MKKFVIIPLSAFLLAVLPSCGSQEIIQNPVLINQPQTVNVLSDEGLIAVNKSIGQLFFDKLDVNKDLFVSFTEYKKMQINDLESRFKSVDKNSDGKISNDEMLRNRKNFLPDIYNKETLKYFAKSAFDTLNTDKNATLSLDEFIMFGVGRLSFHSEPKPVPPEVREFNTTLFTTLDLNYDENLTLSEFEDFIFAQMKAKAIVYNPLDEQPVGQPQPAGN
jgi:Ca2+-binding EF-hand superfamily protein